MPAPDEQRTDQDLRKIRPDILPRYREQLPAARAAVLGRLWGALAREPLDGVRHRVTSGGTLTVTLDDGRTVTGPAAAASPFAAAPDRLHLDGTAHTHPARLVEALALPGETARFVTELDNSVANLALARAADPAPVDRSATVAAEQSVVDGHPLHPCCRTRIGMSTADVLNFAPEHHPVVRLRVVAVDPEHWRVTGVPRPPLLPVHPLQLALVLGSGLARDTGEEIPADPLMSLRTLALPGRATHLKTAVDVQMTSAVRTLSAPTIHNGPLVSVLLKDLSKNLPGFAVLGETSSATVLRDGAPQRSLGAVWREAPAVGAVPLAALAQRPDLLTREFLAALLHVLLPPLLTLLRLGIGLEAHGQNTLVRLAGSRPVGIVYRDFGGIRVHRGRLAAAGVEMPPLIGALPTDDEAELRTTLVAALFGTVLPQLVAASPDPGGTWDRAAIIVRRALDGADRTALLHEPVPVKATTAMRLASNPLDERWAYLPNPMGA